MKNFLKKKKKVILGVLITLAALFALFLIFFPQVTSFLEISVGPPPSDPQARKDWLAETIDVESKSLIVFDEQLPTWEELDEMKQSISTERTYPEFIKATQTYGPESNLVEVLYFGDTLKEMGVNTQFVHAFYWFRGNEFKLMYTDYEKPMPLGQEDAKRVIAHNILLAKQQGLATILFPDYFELENGGMERLGISDDLEDRLEKIALDLANLAEEYNVEYFVPSNQIEMILQSNGYEIEEAQKRTNDFYARVVPKIREIYSGKIMYKMGGFGDWKNYDGISLEGADIFGFTGCYYKKNHDLKFITDDIKIASAQAGKMSRQYGIPWINAEFLISDEETTFGRGEVVEDISIEEYYKAGFKAFDKYAYPAGAKGFTVHSLLNSGQVYGTPAMPLISEFFAEKP